MTNANDPAFPVMHPTGTFSGMTIREQMALTLAAAVLQVENYTDAHSMVRGIELADALIAHLNATQK